MSVTLYVTYTVGTQTYVDEPVVIPDEQTSVLLSGEGGPATGLTISSLPGGLGQTYVIPDDIDVLYGTDDVTGAVTNLIVISTLVNMHRAPITKVTHQDAATMLAFAFATADDQYIVFTPSVYEDAAIPVGLAVISANEVFFPVSINLDAATITGSTVAVAVDQYLGLDSSSVTTFAGISATEVYTPSHGVTADTVPSIALAAASASDVYIGSDSPTLTGLAQHFATDIYNAGTTFTDAATVTGLAVHTATDPFTGIDAATVTGLRAADTTTESAVYEDETILPLALTPSLITRDAHTSTTDATLTTSLYALATKTHAIDAWVRWNTLQPNDGSTVTWPANLDISIDHAVAHGYEIALRIGCGAYSPTWLSDQNVAGRAPVATLQTLASDGSGFITLPVPWDTNLLYWYTNLANQLVPILNAKTAGGNVRANSIYVMPISMAMEISPEMSFSYGTPATYAGSATLTNSLGNTDTTIATSGGSAYPAGTVTLKVDTELILVSHTAASNTFTVIQRGWSGTTVNSHSTTAAITYLDTTKPGVFINGSSQPYDIVSYNTAAWATLGTLTTVQANIVSAWNSSIDAGVSNISNGTGIPVSIGAGQLFGDGYANSTSVVTGKVPLYTDSLFTTGLLLQPGRDGSNNPTTTNGGTAQASYYEGWSPQAALPIRAALSNGGLIGFQLAPKTTFDAFTNPYTGSASALRTVLEDTLSVFGPSFIEFSTDLLGTGVAPDTTDTYLFGSI